MLTTTTTQRNAKEQKRKLVQRGAVQKLEYFYRVYFASTRGIGIHEVPEPPEYIRLLLKALTDVSEGRIRRLLINIPPGHYKSTTVAIIWQVWDWIKNPRYSYICISRNESVGKRDSELCRELLRNPLFQYYFGDLISLSRFQSEKLNFRIEQGGSRFTSTINASILGQRAHRLIIDDPDEIEVSGRRAYAFEESHQWLTQKALDRLNAEDNAVVLIQQRVHPDDMSGFVMRELPGWHGIVLPFVKEDREQELGRVERYGKDRRKTGSLLDPARYTKEHVRQIQAESGRIAWAAKYQQRPSLDEGTVFNKDIFSYYYKVRELGSKVYDNFFALDIALKNKDQADYTVCVHFGAVDDGLLILGIMRIKIPGIEVISYLRSFIAKQRKDAINSGVQVSVAPAVLVEDVGASTLVIQGMQNAKVGTVIPMKRSANKAARAMSSLAYLGLDKKIFLAHGEPLNETIVEEMVNFTVTDQHLHDDIVDCLVDGIGYVNSENLGGLFRLVHTKWI